ncbi:MAG TPA: FliH/SctL family protein [Bryobacteraceae bacterium]|nr:FliH/SctL family protein [Bryobacteraceae bacterium]
MSCRIVSDASAQVRPLQFRKLSSGSGDQGHASMPATPAGAAKSADSAALQNRIAELERSLEAQVRQARERGFQDGMQAGRDTASAEVKPVMDRLLQTISDLVGMRARIRKETEGDLVTLTIAIARRVLRRELSVDPEAIHGVVKAALSKMQLKEINVIRTNPEHTAAVRAYLERAGLGSGIEIVADGTLPVGGVLLETKRGNLDASVDTQLKEIERGFADRLGR